MRKMGKKLVIMVCIAAMIMTNLPNWDAGADVSGTVWSETGDTLIGNAGLGSKEIIMGDRFIENETLWNDTVITLNGNLTVNETGNLTISNVLLTLNGNLTVNETGKLTLDNVTLLMNCSENGSYHIEVLSGGEMRILNNSNITSTDPNNHYLFWVRNDSKFEMRDSELSECGYEWENPSNRGLIIETDNAIIENSTISKNHVGISIHSSSNSRIINCNISNNERAVYLEFSSNNLVSDCNISNNSESGVSFWSSSDNTIIKTIISHNPGGITLWYFSENNTISECEVLSNTGPGIVFPGSSNNTVENSNISSNGFEAIRLNTYLDAESDNNHIMNNIISDNLRGITIEDYCSGNTIESNKIYSNNEWGIRIWACSENTISNCTISSNNETGIYLYNSSDNLIVNSTISGNYSNPEYHDIYLSSNSHLNLLNTTFTNVSFADNASVLNVSWYLNVNVTWKNNISAEYANVRIQDNINGTFDENYTTDKTGWIKNIVIQEYTQNQTAGKTFFTPHNVTASQGYISVWDDNVTVNETKTIELVLDHNAPVINYTTVSPEQEYTIDENTTLAFSFNVSHPDNLNLTYYWYLNGNETFNKTLENTTTPQEINWTYYFNFTSHGNYTVKVTVSDGNATVSCTWVLTVNDVNGRPEITYFYPPKDMILGSYSYARLNITAYDPDNDNMTYEWKLNGKYLPEQINKTEYAFSADYNTSENATNTYLIELTVTDEKLSVNHTWTVVVVDLDTLYAGLLNQTEFLEELTELIEKISYVCANLNQSNLDELNITLHKFYEKYNVLLNQTGLFENIKGLMEQIEDLTEQFSESQDNVTNLRSLLDELNITLEQLNVNLTSNWDELNFTTEEKNDAENKTKEMENKMNNAIEAKNKAEYKLGASVVCGVIGGIIAGFLVSFLLRRKLPKKG